MSVLYEGWVVADGVEPRAEGGDVFVPTEAPMPFGTRVVLRADGSDRAVYVTRVDETVSAGMLLSADPSPRGAPKVDKQGPKPTPAPPPTSVTVTAPVTAPVTVTAESAPSAPSVTAAAPPPESVPEAAPVEVTAENTKPDRPEPDDSKKRRGRSRKPTLT